MLELLDTGARADFVFFARPATDAASTVDDAVADYRHRTLAHDHVPAFGRGNAAECRVFGERGEIAARHAKRRRCNRLALRAVDAGPNGVIHALERDQAAARIAHRCFPVVR